MALRFASLLLAVYVLAQHFFIHVSATHKKTPTVEDRFEDMQQFVGGAFFMGITHEDYAYKGEHPVRQERTKPFALDRFPVTFRHFSQFVHETGFSRTDPELNGFSYVFFSHMTADSVRHDAKKLPSEPWWIPVRKAKWTTPFGPGSSWEGMEKFPVVHVGAADAESYCKWKGKRLPTEYEWEFAARSNNRSWIYPWGDHFRKNRMNTWQGLFPYEDKGYDDWAGLSPVDAYPQQNHMDMYDMLGNVWEWTSTSYYGTDQPDSSVSLVLKGGSFIDSIEETVSTIVRTSTKIGREVDFTAENIGFRCAKDVILPPPPPTTPRVVRLRDTWEFQQQQKEKTLNLARLKQKQKAFVLPPFAKQEL